jgi:hypothetical protein
MPCAGLKSAENVVVVSSFQKSGRIVVAAYGKKRIVKLRSICPQIKIDMLKRCIVSKPSKKRISSA